MQGQFPPAELENFALLFLGVFTRRGRQGLEHHIRDHQRTGDRILFRPHQRHSHLRVTVEYGLNLLGMDFQSPDVDCPVSSADKVVAAIA